MNGGMSPYNAIAKSWSVRQQIDKVACRVYLTDAYSKREMREKQIHNVRSSSSGCGIALLVCNLQDPWTPVAFEHATNVVLVHWGSGHIARYSGMSVGARTLIARGLSASGGERIGVRALFVRVSLCG
jgi:hypothetical protein